MLCKQQSCNRERRKGMGTMKTLRECLTRDLRGFFLFEISSETVDVLCVGVKDGVLGLLLTALQDD